MTRRTPIQGRFRSTPEFTAIAGAWGADSSLLMLEAIWRSYELLYREVLQRIDWRKSDRDVERSVTQLLEPRLRRAVGADAPFDVQHGSYEFETALPPPAQPPQYDLAFVMRQNPRIMWPLEAKVLRSPSAVAAYVADVNEQYLTCRYAPFSAGAAMLGYLVGGQPQLAFAQIARALSVGLRPHARTSALHHRMSDHKRTVPSGKRFPEDFQCHHFIFPLS